MTAYLEGYLCKDDMNTQQLDFIPLAWNRSLDYQEYKDQSDQMLGALYCSISVSSHSGLGSVPCFLFWKQTLVGVCFWSMRNLM